MLTSVLGYGLALPEVATDMITSRGATDDQWTQIAFAAGYCLPQVDSVGPLVTLKEGAVSHRMTQPRVDLSRR